MLIRSGFLAKLLILLGLFVFVAKMPKGDLYVFESVEESIEICVEKQTPSFSGGTDLSLNTQVFSFSDVQINLKKTFYKRGLLVRSELLQHNLFLSETGPPRPFFV